MERQMSDTYRNAVFLTLSGGFMDAYTYSCRQGVFANAQTGNLVLLSKNLFGLDFAGAVRYLLPICAFFAGTFLAELIRRRWAGITQLHWRQPVLLLEILLLFLSGFIPHSGDIAASVLLSFVCALQVQTFRKFHAMVYASTMCIGNMRSASELLCSYLHTKQKEQLLLSLRYLGVIALFTVGAGQGCVLTHTFGIRAIWCSCVFLSVSFVIMNTEA